MPAEEVKSDSVIVDTVAGVFATHMVDLVLPAVHRRGFGHRARLINGSHRQAGAQARRAGLPQAMIELFESTPDCCVLIVDAPHQAAQVAELLLGLGATSVERYATTCPASTMFGFSLASRAGGRPAAVFSQARFTTPSESN